MKRRIGMSTAQESDSTGSAADGIAGRAGSRRLAALLLVLSAAIAGAHEVRAQADSAALVERLGALTRDHVYNGSIYPRSEVIRSVLMAPLGTGLLTFLIDDARESAPLAALVPLREIAEVAADDRGGIYLTCRGAAAAANCVIVTNQRFDTVWGDIAMGQPVSVAHRRRGGFLIGCAPQNCREVLRSVAALQREANARK